MKNYALFFIAIGSAFSFNCLAQSNDGIVKTAKASNTQLLSEMTSSNNLAVVSYHVEERINMNFGGRITTYNVPTLDMINNNNLGENNTRVVTPKYGKVRNKVVPIALTNVIETKSKIEIISTDVKLLKVDQLASERKKDFVSIDVVGTYERIMDKGYKSFDMLLKVADKHFFEGNLVLAAKWYTELFNTNPDLEAVYYYRFAQSLLATGQIAKGNEMMRIFETKSL